MDLSSFDASGVSSLPEGSKRRVGRLGFASLLACGAALFALWGCGPQGPQGVIAGGPFAGESVDEPLDDWRFTDSLATVAIETRGEWFRHSVTVLGVAEGEHLYVPSRQGYRKSWVKNIARDPRVRIEAAGRVYPGRAVRVTDPSEAERFGHGMLGKYFGVEAERARMLLDAPAESDDRIEVWLFRIESTGTDDGDGS